MTLKINDQEVFIQPSEIRWLPISPVGITGDGHFIYPALWEAEIRWTVLDTETYSQLLGFFKSITLTGAAVVALPDPFDVDYTFKNYSGCVISLPEMQGSYFVEHARDIVLRIKGVKV